MRRAFLLLPVLGLAACGEPVRDDHFANDVVAERTAAPPVDTQAVAVRIGELGPSFGACSAAGTTRHLKAGERLPVRAAPFETAAETGGISAESRFFVCTRSHDQKWLGVVFEEGGVLADRCGVNSPVTSRRSYDGPCRSGWVSSAFVRLVAGVEQPPPVTNPAPVESNGAARGG